LIKSLIKDVGRATGVLPKKKRPRRWLDYPNVIQVDTSNKCGPQYCGILCEYCYPQHQIAKGIRPYMDMPMEGIEWIVDEMKRDGREMGFVDWFLNGDATTDDRLPDIYRLSKQRCPWLRTQNFTNGVLYEKRDMLVDQNLDMIAFTISAHTPNLYRKVHGGDRFNDAIKTLEWVLENRHKHQEVEVHMVLTRQNIHTTEEWYHFFSKYPDLNRIISPLVASLDNKPSEKALDNLTLEDQENVIVDVAGERGRMWTRELIGDSKPCVLWDNMSIDVEGYILQCCNWCDPTHINYGTIWEAMREDCTLKEIWKERLANRMRNPLCRSCNMKHPGWRQRLADMTIEAKIK